MPSLLGLPYDAGSSYQRGPAEAPPLIRQALRSDASNLWSEGGVDLGAPGVLDDAGDVALSEGGVREEIERAVGELLGRGARPISLGGDHSVTYPIVRAVARQHSWLTVVQLDAHPDLYAEFDGSRWSHACPFARIMEEGLARRLVQVGIRTMNGHQREQAERYGVEVLEMARWTGALPAVDGPVYLSIDVDGLDPAFAPGVSHREPGGLSVREALRLIQTVGGELVGADVVEYNPRTDLGGVTAVVCAKLVKELAARTWTDERAYGGAR